MGEKDYYLVLGVPRTATTRAIKRAFRQLAKAHHPDRTGSGEASSFQELVEAYEVLSDPGKRRIYNDRALDAGRAGAVPRSRRAGGYRTIVREPAPYVEPLVPEGPPVEPLVREPMSVFDDFRTFGPSVEEITDRFSRNFTGRGMPKSERARGLEVEVVLSPEEALRGGSLALEVPVFSQCPLCWGTGRDWLSACRYCRGRGTVREQETVHVHLPRGTRGGVVEVPLARSGIANFYLRVHVRISEW